MLGDRINVLSCRIDITSPLPADLGRIPFAPSIDFAALIAQAGATGVLDPNSIAVVNLTNGTRVDFARSDDLGRIEWTVDDPNHTAYQIHFATAPTRPPLIPQPYVPLVGSGDLLRYNASTPRPITLANSLHLLDITGDGRADLVGCWNYYHRPGEPISGLVCYPRTGTVDDLLFGDMARLRYIEDGELKHFPGVYVRTAFADMDGDGLVDMAFADRNDSHITFFRNTGQRDQGGLPLFARNGSVAVSCQTIEHLILQDLTGNGAVDLVVNGQLIANQAPPGQPFQPGPTQDLGSGAQIAFLDIDGDGQLELVGVEGGSSAYPPPDQPRALFQRRLIANDPVAYGPPQPLDDIPEAVDCTQLGISHDPSRPGILLQCNAYQHLIFYELANGKLLRRGPLQALSPPVAWSDQAWPCQVDWDGNGVWDLVIGGGYGWPRLVRNGGSNCAPAFDEPQLIHSVDGPIRVLRGDLLGGDHWHNMGYPYPVLIDWDGDGRLDLMLPNETNRIVWHRNISMDGTPLFGPRQYIEVEGFPDSDQTRAASGRLGANADLPNHPYPADPSSPFFWRTGAAFADWNGDGLMDFITHNHQRQATLFVQHIDAQGQRQVRLDGPVRLEDGRPIDDRIVGRQKHWTESFRPCDWNGDGRTDLIYNLAGTGEIYLLRNIGTPQEPLFAAPRQFKYYGEPIACTIHGPNAWAGDFNGDDKPDLLACVEWSVYPFFAHAALEMDRHPDYQIELLR
ncbi:MAG: hypothetical protein GKR89_31465 [Candidatus Latescibacteria bacterium]|nr:hypothetical protein [Candidatus Latescibacterota bacterium]